MGETLIGMYMTIFKTYMRKTGYLNPFIVTMKTDSTTLLGMTLALTAWLEKLNIGLNIFY